MRFQLAIILLAAALMPLRIMGQNTDTTAAQHKPFIISADIREEYDDNIFTSHSDPVASLKTDLSPSFLFTYPMEDTTFSARYTMDAEAYYHRENTWDLSHDFLARVTHSFNDRFSLDARERFLYAQQPEVDQGAVVARVTGDYLNNTFTTIGTMQWTPQLSTLTTFTNDYFDYRASAENGNDRMANTLSNDFRYQLLPTTSLVFGGNYTNLDYFNKVTITNGSLVSRNWQSFSPYVGVDYFVTPEWSLSPRVGITYTSYDADNASDGITPYISLTTDWQVGKKTSLSFNYTHSVSQTDIVTFSAEESDSFSLTGKYQITPLISTHITSYYNIGQDNSDNSLDPTQSKINENTLGLGTGASYDLNNFLSLELGYNLDYITSDIEQRAYIRNRVFMGVRVVY